MMPNNADQPLHVAGFSLEEWIAGFVAAGLSLSRAKEQAAEVFSLSSHYADPRELGLTPGMLYSLAMGSPRARDVVAKFVARASAETIAELLEAEPRFAEFLDPSRD